MICKRIRILTDILSANSQKSGITDCLTENERSYSFLKEESLGKDRDFRRYWFLCRRIFMLVFKYLVTTSQYDSESFNSDKISSFACAILFRSSTFALKPQLLYSTPPPTLHLARTTPARFITTARRRNSTSYSMLCVGVGMATHVRVSPANICCWRL